MSLPNNIPVENGVWIQGLRQGTHSFSFQAGNCQWTTPITLCCCSVTEDYPLDPASPGICENVRDGIPFEIIVFEVKGASDRTARDGSLRVRVESPGPDWTIKWTGPAGFSEYGTYLENLRQGEYCYIYMKMIVNVTKAV